MQIGASLGATLIVIGFFLPWLDGAREFAARDFSGFDLARLVRNFNVVASTSSEAGGLRATAVALYLVPALAVNGAVLAWLQVRYSPIATVIGAVYAAFVLVVALVLSVASWTELQRVLGTPLVGFWVTLAGVAVLGASSLVLLRERLAVGTGTE